MNQSIQREDKILLNLFFISACSIVAGILMWRLYSDSIYSLSLAVVVLLPPVLLLVIHGYITLGIHRITSFFMISSLTGLLFEIYGLKYGTFFGDGYQYGHSNFEVMTPSLFGVPLIVVCYWALFIYLAYSLTNSFLARLHISLPTNMTGRVWQVVVISIIDSLIVLSIDIFMDPVAIAFGGWSWKSNGVFFEVPLGNFVGWFIVALIASLVFRLYEYFNPNLKKIESEIVTLLPYFFYLTILSALNVVLILNRMTELAIICSYFIAFIVTMFIYIWNKKQP